MNRLNDTMTDFKSCLEEIKARVCVSSVVGKRVKLRRIGREFVGLSPFTAEKTPSFTVNDDKKFWHCFSSGLHGDIFSFLQHVDHLSFKQAVEQLAAQAGVRLPGFDRIEDARAHKQRLLLKQIIASAVRFFQRNLEQDQRARQYLEGRGVHASVVDTFQLGYAPEKNAALKDHLIKQDFLFDDIVKAGLISQDGPYALSHDKFRGRIMFPIHDDTGHVVAFGGRVLTPHPKRPKYLNSPQTSLFHKGTLLYNYHRARASGIPEEPLIVVEGYMDAITLWQAEFRSVVATMGTALTEQQMNLIWRVSPSPVLCFDGDTAGLQAAFRVVERALPILKPGYSFTFCLLPDKKDPHDIVREDGPRAFRELLEQREQLVDVVWRYIIDGKALATPEQKALLEAHARTVIGKIGDRSIRTYYKREIDRRTWALLRQPAPARKADAAQKMKASLATEALKRSPLVEKKSDATHMAVSALLLVAAHHPRLLHEYGDRVLSIPVTQTGLSDLRREMISCIAERGEASGEELWQELVGRGFKEALEQLRDNPLAKSERSTRPDADFGSASAWFLNILRHWEEQRALKENLERLRDGKDFEASLQQLRLLHSRLREQRKSKN